MTGTCIICWTLLDTSSKYQGNTEEHEIVVTKPFRINTAILLSEISRPKTGEEPSRKETKKFLAWLLCGIEEIETPRGFQRKNPKGSLVKNISKYSRTNLKT